MLFMPSRVSGATAHPRPSELRSTTTSMLRLDRKLNDREQEEQAALLEVVPDADCPVYPSGISIPHLHERRAVT